MELIYILEKNDEDEYGDKYEVIMKKMILIQIIKFFFFIVFI